MEIKVIENNKKE